MSPTERKYVEAYSALQYANMRANFIREFSIYFLLPLPPSFPPLPSPPLLCPIITQKPKVSL